MFVRMGKKCLCKLRDRKKEQSSKPLQVDERIGQVFEIFPSDLFSILQILMFSTRN